MQTLLLLLLVGLAGAVTRGGRGRGGLAALVLVASGWLLAGAGGVHELAVWLITGLATGLVLWLSYMLVLRRQPALVPVAVGTMAALSLLREASLAAYPEAPPGLALAIAALCVSSVWWSARLEADTAGSPCEGRQ